jgi:hypothetical protein
MTVLTLIMTTESRGDPENCSESRLRFAHWKNRPIAEKQRRKSTNSREEMLKQFLEQFLFSNKQAET